MLAGVDITDAHYALCMRPAFFYESCYCHWYNVSPEHRCMCHMHHGLVEEDWYSSDEKAQMSETKEDEVRGGRRAESVRAWALQIQKSKQTLLFTFVFILYFCWCSSSVDAQQLHQKARAAIHNHTKPLWVTTTARWTHQGAPVNLKFTLHILKQIVECSLAHRGEMFFFVNIRFFQKTCHAVWSEPSSGFTFRQQAVKILNMKRIMFAPSSNLYGWEMKPKRKCQKL